MVKTLIIENWNDRAREIDAILKKFGSDTFVSRIYQGEKPKSFDYDALVLTGSPLSVNEYSRNPFIKWEMNFVEDAIQRKLPILGVCFGQQLTAKVLGASIVEAENPEVGWYKLNLNDTVIKQDPLFYNLSRDFEVFQFHFDEVVPSDSLGCIIISSPKCSVEGFRYDNHVWGIQFHPEISPSRSREIFEMESVRKVLLKRDYDTDKIVKEPQHNTTQKQRESIFENFVKYVKDHYRH